MNQLELAHSLKHGLFADRDTLSEAMEYAYQVIAATKDQGPALTALHVVLNTVAKEIERLGKE
jgi:hypothetical protein